MKTLEDVAKDVPPLTPIQQHEIDDVIAKYSKVLKLSEAREYICNIMNSGLWLARNLECEHSDIFNTLITEMRTNYFRHVIPNKDREFAAKVVLANLQDKLLSSVKAGYKTEFPKEECFACYTHDNTLSN